MSEQPDPVTRYDAFLASVAFERSIVHREVVRAQTAGDFEGVIEAVACIAHLDKARLMMERGRESCIAHAARRAGEIG